MPIILAYPATLSNYRPVARRFVEDMHAFFAKKNGIKRDEIAARQLQALRQHYAGKLKLIDVREMFLQMKDQACP